MENSSAGSLSQRLQEYIAKAVSQGYPAAIFSDARSENDIVLAMGVHMKNQYLALNYPASVFDSCTTPVEIKNAATAYREALVQERAEAEQKRLAHAANLARATVEQERLANHTNPVTPIPIATAMAQPESQPGAKYRKVKVDWLGINQEKIVGTYAICFFALLLIYGLNYFVKFDDHTLRMLQIPVWVCVTGTSFFIVYKLASPTYINIQTHRPQSPPLAPTPAPTPTQETTMVVEEPPTVVQQLSAEPHTKTANEILQELIDEKNIANAKLELAKAEKNLANETSTPETITIQQAQDEIRKSIKELEDIKEKAKIEGWTDAELKAMTSLSENYRANISRKIIDQS